MGSLPNEKVVKILRQMVSLDPKNLTDVLLKNESLKQKINPNEYKELSVEAAILSNDSKLTNDLLLEQEIDPQIMEKFFIKAVQHSDVSTVKVLLDHGANPNTIFDTKFQTNALHEVIVQGREEIFLPLLLDRDVDPNGVDNDMFTPLYYAVSKNKEKAVEVILEKAGDIMRPEHIESAFNDTFSSWNFNSKLIERFLDKKIIGKLSGKVLGQCLKEALERKDEGVIEKFTSSEFLAVASKEQLEAIIDHVKNETSHSNIVEILEKAKTPDSPESSTKTTSRTITEIFDKTETTRIGSLSSSSPSKKGKQESSLNCVKSGNFSL
jgi:ankyrin repeat protein